MIEEQHQAVVDSANVNKEAKGAKVGFVSLGWPKKTLKPFCNSLNHNAFILNHFAY